MAYQAKAKELPEFVQVPRTQFESMQADIRSMSDILRNLTNPLSGGQLMEGKSSLSPLPLSSAIDQMIAAKEASGLRPRYLMGLRLYLAQFARGRENQDISEIGVSELEKWFGSRKEAFSTRASNMGRLSALFAFHVRRGALKENPVKRMERVRVERKPPIILTPEQAETLLRLAPILCKPYVILGMLAGIRPEEIMKLTWDDVCLDTKTVRVNGAKTRRRRIVPLEPKAVALLDACHFKKGNIVPSHSTVRRFKRAVCKALGFTNWPQDLLRHTFGSYVLALHQDAGKVATMMGNSASILLIHYHEPVKASDCERFWKV